METLRDVVDVEKNRKKKQQIVDTEDDKEVKKKQNEDEEERRLLDEEQNKQKLNDAKPSQFNLNTKKEEETSKTDDNKDNKKEENEEIKTKEECLIRKDKTLDNNNLNLKSLEKENKKEDNNKGSSNLINSGFLESGLKHWGVSTEFKGVNNVVDFKASTFHTGSYLQGNFFNNTAPSLTMTFGLLKGLHSRHKQISNSIAQAIEYARKRNISVFESFKHIKFNLMSSKTFATFRPTYTKKVFFSKGRKMGNITVIR